MPASSRRLRHLVALSLAAACAPAAAPAGTPAGGAPAAGALPPAAEPVVPAARPLASLVGRPTLLFPVQAVRGIGGLEPAMLDAEIAFALEERRAARTWTGPDALRRLARTSAAYASDPAALALPAAPLRAGTDVREPLAGQLRALAALTDARVVVVPTTLAADGGEAALGVVVVDVRGARVVWAGTTAPVPLQPAAGLAARVAGRFADLAAPPFQD